MSDANAVLVFYLGIAELLLSGYLFWIAYNAMKNSKGKSFYRTTRAFCVAVLLFFTVQAVSMSGLMGAGMLEVLSALSSIILVLLLICVVRELSKGMMAHEHLMKHRRHGRRDLE